MRVTEKERKEERGRARFCDFYVMRVTDRGREEKRKREITFVSLTFRSWRQVMERERREEKEKEGEYYFVL